MYNQKRGSKPQIEVSSLYTGSAVTLDGLLGINLVLCDITMPHETGHAALARLKGQAELQRFTLPPFIATTSETDYHNIGEGDPVKCEERLAYAQSEHFIGGRGKVCTLIDLQKTLDYCSEVLGDKWLATHIGRYIVPIAVPKLLVDFEEQAEVLEEEPGRPTFSVPERTTYGSSSMSSGSPKKSPGKKITTDSSEMYRSSGGSSWSSPRQRTPCDWRKLLCCRCWGENNRVEPYSPTYRVRPYKSSPV